jgi:hypothetical protein
LKKNENVGREEGVSLILIKKLNSRYVVIARKQNYIIGANN